MEGFRRSTYSSQFFSKIELLVIILAVVLVAFIAFPKVTSILYNIKLNSAIDSANSYKESVNNYYVSQLLLDNDFKLDGFYTISDGKLVDENDIYNILMTGNVPSTGYLDYENNVLKDGCIVIGEYSVIVENGNVVSASKGNCELNTEDIDIALSM